MSERPTPETDAEYKEAKDYEPSTFVEPLAKFLAAERERDEARKQVENLRKERDDAREAFKIVYNERVQMELERNEWKNKAYSHATDYTLMEAKCFRLEQQLKEYDQLKS